MKIKCEWCITCGVCSLKKHFSRLFLAKVYVLCEVSFWTFSFMIALYRLLTINLLCLTVTFSDSIIFLSTVTHCVRSDSGARIWKVRNFFQSNFQEQWWRKMNWDHEMWREGIKAKKDGCSLLLMTEAKACWGPQEWNRSMFQNCPTKVQNWGIYPLVPFHHCSRGCFSSLTL